MSHDDESFQVKGSTIRTKLRFVAERFGEDAEEALMARIRDTGCQRVLEASWYPYALYETVLEAIIERHYGGDVAAIAEAGAYSARRALTTTYDAFARGKGFEQFLQLVPHLHQRFYSHGTLTVEHRPERHRCRFSLRGLPRYADADYHLTQGFFVGVAELLGLPQPEGTFERQPGGGDFTVRWSPAPPP